MDGDFDVRAIAGEGFVDGVVDHFENAVMEPALMGVANVHVWAFPYTFQAFQLLNFRGVVVVYAFVIYGTIFGVGLRIHIVVFVN